MTRKETEILIGKYLDGMTTNAEEDRLRRYFAEMPADEVPEEWRVYKALFAWETGHATAGDAATELAAITTEKPTASDGQTGQTDRTAPEKGKAGRTAVMRRIDVLLASACFIIL